MLEHMRLVYLINVLEAIFGECVISREMCPSRSPDLSPLDYFFWRAVKEMFNRQFKSIAELKKEIQDYVVYFA